MSSPDYKVLLPERIWEENSDKKDIVAAVKQYMKRYPHYRVKGVKNKKAICERKDGFF
jgi:hypothetical protein